MENLPNEIIRLIVSFLPKSTILDTLVMCKQWYKATIKLLWQNQDILLVEWDEFRKLFSKPLYEDYRMFILSLNVIEKNIPCNSIKIRNVLSGCHSLISLKIDCPSLNDDDLWIITSRCKQLKSLSFVSNNTWGRISDEGLNTITKNSIFLQHLTIKSVSLDVFTERGLLCLNAYKGKLLSFGLEFICSENYYKDPEYTTKFIDALTEIIRLNPQLENLSIDWPLDMDKILSSASNNLHNLKSLKLGNLSCTTQLVCLLNKNPNILHLHLEEFGANTNLSDILLPLHINGTSPLKSLELKGVGDFNNLLPLIPQFPNLELLLFTPSTRYASLLPSQTNSIPINCPKLKKVILPINDNQSLFCFAYNHLESLDIQDGRAITNDALIIILSRLKLQSLKLGFATLYDSGIDALVKYQSKTLIELKLPSPCKFSVEAFQALASGLNLKILLNLSIDLGFGNIEKGICQMTRLQELSLGTSDLINMPNVSSLKRNNKKLKYLTINKNLF
jgi:hypothetical protein